MLVAGHETPFWCAHLSRCCCDRDNPDKADPASVYLKCRDTACSLVRTPGGPRLPGLASKAARANLRDLQAAS